MAILAIVTFGGIIPKVKDSRILPDGKSQTAVNCRFDHGGIEAILNDLVTNTPTNTGPILSIFLYQYANKFLAWNSDVKALTAPLANDAHHRIFYTEGGKLKVTDDTLYDQGGTDYPEAWLYPTPPVPTNYSDSALSPITASAMVLKAYNQIWRVWLTNGVVKMYSPPLQDAGVSNIGVASKLLINGTNIPSLDNNSFAITNVVISGTGYLGALTGLEQESFDLIGVTSLGSGVITAISKATLGVVTSIKHGLSTGDTIKVVVTGMTALNGYISLSATYVDADNFSIGISTTGLPDCTGGTWFLLSRDLNAVFTDITITDPTDTISKSNPCTVKHASHGLISGTALNFHTMVGMTQLEGVTVAVTVVDVDNFTLNGINSTAYTTFVSGKYTQIPSFAEVQDATLLSSRYYVETFVNTYGSEGAPCLPSNIIDVYDGDRATITDLITVPSSQYGVVSRNLYRSNVDSTGTEVLQYLDTIPLVTVAGGFTVGLTYKILSIGTTNFMSIGASANTVGITFTATGAGTGTGTARQTSYSDLTKASALGEVISSTLWDAPPDGIEGITALSNQTLAAFSGNLVLFSEPGYPYAWPTTTYQKATDTNVMGIGAFGTSALILTTGTPYLISGNAPSNNVMDRLGVGYGCVSKRSVVQLVDMVYYASTDGLAAMGTGQANIITSAVISPEEWIAKYNPTTISGYYWEGKYIGFYSGTSGFVFDPKTGDLIDLDFYATAGYHDEVSGSLYLMVGNNIVAFAKGTTSRSLSSKTKRYKFRKTSIGAVKVMATAFPVTIQSTFYSYANDGTQVATTSTLIATSDREFRHPPVGLTEECEVTILGNVTAIYFASSMAEFQI